MKTIFFGSSDFAASILQDIYQVLNVIAVISQPDQPAGRKHILTPTLVAKLSEQLGLKVFKPTKLTPEFIEDNKELLSVDLFIVAAYGQLLPETLLNIPKHGSINVHGSLLPKYRGASPIQHAILNGEKVSGVSLILMDKELDHGPILAEQEIEISSGDTSESLRTKLAKIASPLLAETANKYLKREIEAKKQDHSKATFCKQITKQESYFDIDNPPSKEELDRMIRAYFPWPNVWTKWNEKVVKFYPNGLVQMEGKNKVKLHEFLNGYPNFPIKSLD